MTFNEQDIDTFLASSSFNGLGVIYILELSFNNKSAFNFDDLFSEIFTSSKDYCYGYIVACYAIGLLNYNYKNGIMTVVSINPLISEKIKNSLETRTESIESRLSDIKKIEKYFEN